MKNHFWRYTLVIAMAVGLVLTTGRSVLAQEPDSEEEVTIFITNPQDGATLSGSLIITGAVDFPDFLKYEVLLKSGDSLSWVATVYAPVINGNLARFDTRTFLDGTYQLIIRPVRSDSNYTDFVGPTITLANGLGSPLPFPEQDSSYLYPPPNHALLRVKNCAYENAEFDYNSPEGFRSSGMLWLMPRPIENDASICFVQDILLIPGEYRGTAVGEGRPEGVSYSFIAEAGKIYEAVYNGPGGGQFHFFITELEPDERASTDVGDQPGDRTTRPELPTTGNIAGYQTQTGPSSQSAASAAPPAAQSSAPAAAPTASAKAPSEIQTMLPVSGQGTETKVSFVVAAIGLILLLIGGGIWATRRRGYIG